MDEEIQDLQINHTLDLVELPVGKTVARCRWIFTFKLKADGSLGRL